MAVSFVDPFIFRGAPLGGPSGGLLFGLGGGLGGHSSVGLLRFFVADDVYGCNQLGKLLALEWVSELFPPLIILALLEDEIGIRILSSCRFHVKFNSLGASEQEECGCEFCEGH